MKPGMQRHVKSLSPDPVWMHVPPSNLAAVQHTFKLTIATGSHITWIGANFAQVPLKTVITEANELARAQVDTVAPILTRGTLASGTLAACYFVLDAETKKLLARVWVEDHLNGAISFDAATIEETSSATAKSLRIGTGLDLMNGLASITQCWNSLPGSRTCNLD